MNDRSDARSPTALIQDTARPNEAAILNAALEAFADKGFNGASMRDIAQGARTSLSNLYNYFPSKSRLLAALLRLANDEQLRRTRSAVDATHGSAATRMAAAVKAFVGFVVDHQLASLVAISEIRYLTGADRDEVVAARDSTQAIFEEIVADGASSGDFATPYPDGAARNIVSMCSAISTWYQAGGSLSKEQLEGQHAQYALGLLQARDL